MTRKKNLIKFQFGTLVLSNGTYLIEPVKSHQPLPSSIKAHIVYKTRSHSFHDLYFSDYINSSISASANNNIYFVQNDTAIFLNITKFDSFNIDNTANNASGDINGRFLKNLIFK